MACMTFSSQPLQFKCSIYKTLSGHSHPIFPTLPPAAKHSMHGHSSPVKCCPLPFRPIPSYDGQTIAQSFFFFSFYSPPGRTYDGLYMLHFEGRGEGGCSTGEIERKKRDSRALPYPTPYGTPAAPLTAPCPQWPDCLAVVCRCSLGRIGLPSSRICMPL